MDQAKFFDSDVGVLDMVYDSLFSQVSEGTLYKTSINGAPTAILIGSLLDSVVAVGRRKNMSFMATIVDGKTFICYNGDDDITARELNWNSVKSFINKPSTITIKTDPNKDRFINNLVQTVLA